MSVKEKIKEDHLVDVLEQNLNEIILYNDDVNTFDHVIEIPKTPPFYSECLAWELSPYKETFKLECDMLI